MNANDSFQDFYQQLVSCDEAAAEEIVYRYALPLADKAREYLEPAVRAKVDAEDVVQSALGSFFRRHQNGDFQLENWAALWGLLLTITIRKCRRKASHYHAARRDVAREDHWRDEHEQQPVQLAPDHQPSGEELLLLAELIDELMAKLELPSHRNILSLSLQGYSAKEISVRVSRAERTVFRVLENVRQRLEWRRAG